MRIQKTYGVWKLLLVALPLVLVCQIAAPQATLPPGVQADMLKAQIFEALTRKDFKLVLSEMDKYRRLEQQGVEVPVPLLFYEAKAAAEVGDAVRAHDALEAYLKRATSADRNYAEAIRWYPTLARQRSVGMEKQKQAAEAAAAQKTALDAKLAAERERAQIDACSSGPLRSEMIEFQRGVLRQCGTTLEWAQSDNGGSISWNDARTYCAAKGPGWALPSSEELLGLHDASSKVRCDDSGNYFCRISQLFRLSGISVWVDELIGPGMAKNATLTWEKPGTRSGLVNQGNIMRALCVRRTTEAAAARRDTLDRIDRDQNEVRAAFDRQFVEAADEVLVDTRNSLRWSRSDQRTVSWQEIKRTCEAKGVGWRVPTYSELASLYDAKGGGVVCGVAFCRVSSKFRLSAISHWASDEPSTGTRVQVEFYREPSAGQRASPNINHSGLLCVRGR